MRTRFKLSQRLLCLSFYSVGLIYVFAYTDDVHEKASPCIWSVVHHGGASALVEQLRLVSYFLLGCICRFSMQMRQSCYVFLGLPSFFTASLHARTARYPPEYAITTRSAWRRSEISLERCCVRTRNDRSQPTISPLHDTRLQRGSIL
jgi:hypothetical protein